MKLHKSAILGLVHTAEKSGTGRENLAVVRVFPDGSTVSTNGHQLTQFTPHLPSEPGPEADAVREPFSFPLDSVKLLKTLMGRESDSVGIEEQPNGHAQCTTAGGPMGIRTFPEADHEYPKWEQVFPKLTDPRKYAVANAKDQTGAEVKAGDPIGEHLDGQWLAEFCLSKAVLTRMLKALTASGVKEKAGLRFRISKNQMVPIQVDCDAPDGHLTSILMPMRY